jgi:8-amino-7-oxononanoate synthase
MSVSLSLQSQRIREALQKRRSENAFRNLQPENNKTDFCSNDYLGFARSPELQEEIAHRVRKNPSPGSTGSRLLRGNTRQCEMLEQKIADFHGAETGLIFNSGYDANVGLFSALAFREDIYLYDSLIHASVRDGIRLSKATAYSFHHNDTVHLEDRLKNLKSSGQIYVAIESVYSMDGDEAPLARISQLCEQYGALLIVDEAHSTGLIGDKGEGLVVAQQLEKKVFARVHTFGKALGCHGAIVLGSVLLRDWLINTARSFIYTTALPPVSLYAIEASYDRLVSSSQEMILLQRNIDLFNTWDEEGIPSTLNSGRIPIKNVLVPGNDAVKQVAAALQDADLDVRAILYPTVPMGGERLRICIHSFNTEKDVLKLVSALKMIMKT